MTTNLGSTATTTPRPGVTGQPKAEEHREGKVAKAIEDQTAKMPSDWFLWAAVGSMAASLMLQSTGRRQMSNFVGQWAPTLLILGLYNKVVKIAGSDQTESRGTAMKY